MADPDVKTDDQLWLELDAPDLWILRSGTGDVLTLSFTLRHALRQAHGMLRFGVLPGSLGRVPGDNVIVPSNQIYRLWERAGLVRQAA